MVAVLGAEAVEDDLVAVGHVVAVRVLDEHQVRLLGHVDAAVPEFEAGRQVEAPGKHGVTVGSAVAVAVLEDHDPVVGFLVGKALRVGRHRRHPEPAAGVEGQGDGIADREVLLGGEQRHLVALGGVEALQRVRRVAGLVPGFAALVRFLVADLLGRGRTGNECGDQPGGGEDSPCAFRLRARECGHAAPVRPLRAIGDAAHRSTRSNRQTSPERASAIASRSSSPTSSSKRTISGGKEWMPKGALRPP